MKRPATALAMVAIVLLVAGTVLAAGKPQTTCPVTGKPIDPKTSPHVDYQGQRVYFCCNDCPAKFKADPDTYFAKMEKDGVTPENIQTSCPVSGEKLGSMGDSPTVTYKGRTVRFCCKACIKDFDKTPAKFLDKMPGEQPVAKSK
jgi:YHS domain-containing protein